MAPLQLIFLVAVAMLAFAGNSLLCRLALKHTSIDAATFTTIRLLSGACMLWLVVQWQRRTDPAIRAAEPAFAGNWTSAFALFVYAAGFSFAYISMSAATGALLLFGAVQVTMIGYGLYRGERLQAMQMLGFALALAGLVVLMLPGLATPGLPASLSMLGAGVAWGVYSLRGRATQNFAAGNPTAVTAGNFIRAVPMALVLTLLMMSRLSLDLNGTLFAMASGALASGIGYAIWYQALPALASTQAATVQLSVPVIAALGGVVFIGEALTLPMVLASGAILGGIALVILKKRVLPQ
jgi:drug/metabolite transporter (DMT)-like permease